MKLEFAGVSRNLSSCHSFLLTNVNDHCLPLAMFLDKIPWHCHPSPKQVFVALEGALEVELEAGSVTLRSGEAHLPSARIWHQTRVGSLTVNLCSQEAEADIVFR